MQLIIPSYWKKLKLYAITDTNLPWFESYLFNRKQHIHVGQNSKKGDIPFRLAKIKIYIFKYKEKTPIKFLGVRPTLNMEGNFKVNKSTLLESSFTKTNSHIQENISKKVIYLSIEYLIKYFQQPSFSTSSQKRRPMFFSTSSQKRRPMFFSTSSQKRRPMFFSTSSQKRRPMFFSTSSEKRRPMFFSTSSRKRRSRFFSINF